MAAGVVRGDFRSVMMIAGVAVVMTAAAVAIVAVFRSVSVAGDDRRGLFGVMTAARCAVLLLQRRGGVDAAAVVSCSLAAAAFICRGRVRYCFPPARAGAPAGVGIDCRRRRPPSLACLVYFRRFRLFSSIAQNFDRLCAPVRDLNDLAYALPYHDLPRFPAVACCSIPPCFPPCRPPCCSRRVVAGDCRRRAALRMAAGVVRGDFRSVMMIAGVAVLCRARLAALHAFVCRLFHISTPRRVPPQKLGA